MRACCLNNPSMRAALFAPVKAEDTTLVGQLTECAIFAQWQHSIVSKNLRYARWRNEGEVDIVYIHGDQKPQWIGEIKWSDSIKKDWNRETSSLAALMKRHKSISSAIFTTKTLDMASVLEGRPLRIHPSAAYCYIVGRNVTATHESELLTEVSKLTSDNEDVQSPS